MTGGAIAKQLHSSAQWSLVTASRRERPWQLQDATHDSVDLLDPAQARSALTGMCDVTHVVYAAYAERATMAAMTEPNVAILTNTLNGLRAAGASLGFR